MYVLQLWIIVYPSKALMFKHFNKILDFIFLFKLVIGYIFNLLIYNSIDYVCICCFKLMKKIILNTSC
jgi:hypothetical protein